MTNEKEVESRLLAVGISNSVIIGRLEVGKSILRDPRILLEGKHGGEQIIVFSSLPGSPKEIFIHNMNFSYSPTDERVVNAYLEETTGIKLVQKIVM